MKNEKLVLVIDGSKAIHDAFDILLAREYDLIHCYTAGDAIDQVEHFYKEGNIGQLGIAFVADDVPNSGMEPARLVTYLKRMILPQIKCFGIGACLNDGKDFIWHAGADGYFTKPFQNPDDIIKMVRDALSPPETEGGSH